MKNQIDFVVTWVDGNDPEWLKEREQYMPKRETSASSRNRYRDWDLMRYWFRGIEKFAPWVNKVYFITCGHYPEWLNMDNPKLVPIKHSDYIPQECLPTYNSNVIELYLNRIKDLSEHFVLFNDDMFILDHVNEADFFQNGVPCETIRLGQTFGLSTDDIFAYTMFNNVAMLNKHFNKKRVIKQHWKKFYTLKYGKELIRNILLFPFGHFSGFLDTHLPVSHLKSTFDEVWEKEEEYLNQCGLNRFRTKQDVTHWLMKNWRACQGRFVPRSIRFGKSFAIEENSIVADVIKGQKYKVICANDCDPDLDFDKCRKMLIDAFEAILPDKSGFEK